MNSARGSPFVRVSCEHLFLGCLPEDSKGLVEAVVRLLDDPKLAYEIGRNARRKAQKLYDWQKIADLTLEVYTRLT